MPALQILPEAVKASGRPSGTDEDSDKELTLVLKKSALSTLIDRNCIAGTTFGLGERMVDDPDIWVRLQKLAPTALHELQTKMPVSVVGVTKYFVDAAEILALVDRFVQEAVGNAGQGRRIYYSVGKAAPTAPQPSKDPLQAARDRGMNSAVQEWLKPENLTLRDAAIYAGRSDRMINEERQKGRLYALVVPGKERGFRYPMWQFQAEPDRLATALAPFIDANASCWVVHSFMQREEEPLDNLRPMDWVLDHRKPIDRLVRLVDARFNGEQGAA